eukprot:71677-Rhodomonas_salina.1
MMLRFAVPFLSSRNLPVNFIFSGCLPLSQSLQWCQCKASRPGRCRVAEYSASVAVAARGLVPSGWTGAHWHSGRPAATGTGNP